MEMAQSDARMLMPSDLKFYTSRETWCYPVGLKDASCKT